MFDYGLTKVISRKKSSLVVLLLTSALCLLPHAQAAVTIAGAMAGSSALGRPSEWVLTTTAYQP
jgi:hypothetical protein